eukprot:TRINITY_DN1057_c0_g1_i1.p2 TRINITY_DN1057_c0_g1~~TRINITY_DN1057_c0_g1_i1.p2  ORF type:complete len:476 (+),score=188.71 TRINITY_DN1057_c0_g1_i1:342-1769(+)
MNFKKYVTFSGRIVVIGCGSIGQAILPMIFRHINVPASRVEVITADERGRSVAAAHGVKFTVEPLTPSNYEAVLGARLGDGDFLLNVSVDVSSCALIEFCAKVGSKYLDTCTEPWLGGYEDGTLSSRSNYAQREGALALRERLSANGPTAVITHGANPGLVSHFVKAALLNLARDAGRRDEAKGPINRRDWATLARDLGVKVIHIAERDTQVSLAPKQPDEFVNTWSIDGFISEGAFQPAELGWGSHEKELPGDGRHHEFGCNAAIYLDRPGALTRVRTWTPNEGPFHGFLITHSEAISIADYFTLPGQDPKRPEYRPTVHYAYHPCDAAVLSLHELAGKNMVQQTRQRLIVDEVTSGMDELGVLLMGDFGSYWYGSQLTIEQARRLAPYQNATGLQVTSSVLGAMVWAIEHPNEGVVEPDEVDHTRVLEVAVPYLGDVVGVKSKWTPLEGRQKGFADIVDHQDPWQFKNFRVHA